MSFETIRTEEQKVYTNENRNKKSKSIDMGGSFVANNANEPIGLNFGDFLPKNDLENPNEAKVLNEINENHEPIIAVIKRRSESINLVLN